MPKYTRRRFTRRKPTWRKKKYFRMKRKKAFKRTMKMNPCYLKTNYVLGATTASGVFKAAINANGSPTDDGSTNIYGFFHYGVTADAGTNATNITSAELIKAKEVWSSCRLAAVKIQFIPRVPNDTSSTASFYPMYIHYDPDGVEYGYYDMSVDKIIGTANFKAKNMARPWKYYVKFPKRKLSSREFAPNRLTTVQGSENYAGIFHDIGNGTADHKAANANHIFIAMDQATAALNWGSMIFTFYWVLRDRYY